MLLWVVMSLYCQLVWVLVMLLWGVIFTSCQSDWIAVTLLRVVVSTYSKLMSCNVVNCVVLVLPTWLIVIMRSMPCQLVWVVVMSLWLVMSLSCRVLPTWLDCSDVVVKCDVLALSIWSNYRGMVVLWHVFLANLVELQWCCCESWCHFVFVNLIAL